MSDNHLSQTEFEVLANFRYQIRRYLRFSEKVVRAGGITPLQYQLLLQIKGFPEHRRASITDLAERLQARHHGVVALISRCEAAGLVKRQSGNGDRRRVEITLTAEGESRINSLAGRHRDELELVNSGFVVTGFGAQSDANIDGA